MNAVTCSSWLLDPQFEDWLKPESNIVRFLREWYLAPRPGANDGQTFERIFGGPVDDINTAPRDSSLRRAILDHMKAGGRWRSTASVIFPEDINWGAQVYRNGRAFIV